MNEPEEKDAKEIRYTQAEVNYRLLSDTPGKACVNCRWYRRWDSTCFIVEEWPDPIVLTGLSDEWQARPEPPEPAPVPVVIVGDESKEEGKDIPPSTDDASAKEDKQPPAPDVLSRFAAWIKSNLLQIEETKELEYGFKAHPTNNTWLAWWTTTTKDLEGEYFPTKAVDEYIGRVKSGVEPYPELWMFHLPLVIGHAKELGRVGLIAYAAGEFDDTPRAKQFQSWSRKRKDALPESHGFKYIKSLKRNSAYWHFNTFEISPLHPVYQKAANPIAKFSEVYDMTIKPEQIKALADVAGSDELAQQWAAEALAAMERKSKELEAQGVDFKDTGEPPVIPVVDADARKDIEAVKSAQASLEKTLTEAVSKAVKESGEALAKQLADELTKRDTTIKELTDKVAKLETDRAEEKQLHPPASNSYLTQFLEGSKDLKEAEDLRKKNAEPPQQPILAQMLGEVIPPPAQ